MTKSSQVSKSNGKQFFLILLLFAMFMPTLVNAKGESSLRQQQERILKGVVYDSKGIPLANVTVLVNTYESGTVTNENGAYSITVKAGDRISFNYIGYKTQAHTISTQEILNVNMEEEVESLEEVVLIGYGQKQRKELVSSVSLLEGNSLSKNFQIGTTIDRNLAGMVKGVYVKQGSGQPGKGVDINIRGVTSPFASNSDNNPLYVVDGIPFYTNPNDNSLSPLTAISSEDIESISILKDAASTAIYGSRGANGVILIKTKRGKLNQEISTSFSVSTTLATPIRDVEYMNANQYKTYTIKALENSLKFAEENNVYATMFGGTYRNNFDRIGIDKYENKLIPKLIPGNPPSVVIERIFDHSFNPSKIKFYDKNTNWTDEVFRKPSVTNSYNFSFRGGGTVVSYNASLGHINQEGLVKKEKFKQYNMHLSLDARLREKISSGLSINTAMTNHNWGYNEAGDFSYILGARPDVAIYDKKGNFSFIDTEKKNFHRVNPLGLITGNKNSRDGLNGTVNAYLKAKPLKDLELGASLGGTLFSSKKEAFTPGKYHKDGYQYVNSLGNKLKPRESELNYTKSSSKSLTIDLTANYYKKIKKHGISAMLGASRYRQYIDVAENIRITDFPDDEILTTPAQGKNKVARFTVPTSSGINSGFGRFNYNYDSRYSLSGTVRLDKSSKFGPENRSAWFPSVSAGWNIHNESFFNKATGIANVLKIRGSYGVSGTANVADFTFKKFFYPSDLYNGNIAISAESRLPNRAIGWEKTTELNLGLEIHLFNSRVTIDLDAYDKTTDGVIMDLDFPRETGKMSFTTNFGKVNNKGIEIDMNGYLLRTENFEWSLGFNASKNINKLVEADLTNMSKESAKRFKIGESTNLIRGYIADGIIKDKKTLNQLNDFARKKDMEINKKKKKDENVFYHTPTTSAGDYMYRDINGDGKITEKDGEEILGSAYPDWFGGFNTRFRYKNFEIVSAFSFSTGAKMLRLSDQLEFIRSNPFTNALKRYDIENRWSPKNKNATLPRLIYMNPNNIKPSSENVFDASYIKWRSLQLSYKLPVKLVHKVGFSNVSFFIKGNNLHTWTKYPGIDPEASSGGISQAGGSRSYSDPYPTAKSWSFGVTVRF